jgi:hypothetical protein
VFLVLVFMYSGIKKFAEVVGLVGKPVLRIDSLHSEILQCSIALLCFFFLSYFQCIKHNFVLLQDNISNLDYIKYTNPNTETKLKLLPFLYFFLLKGFLSSNALDPFHLYIPLCFVYSLSVFSL